MPTEPLRVGSLFAGIGGFDLGLERAGMQTAWFCEQDPFCQRVLAKHWPGVPCYDDVCELTGATLSPVDVLCGGFPCQDISVAGKGAGIDGARSGLWSEYARLVGELRPRYVIVENVAILLARGLDRVLGDLAALGYDAEWDCIPASAVGAPHRRDRIWLVAYPGRERGAVGREARDVASAPRAGETDREQWQRDGHAPDDCRPDVADSHCAGSQGRGRSVERAREVATAEGGAAARAGEVAHPAGVDVARPKRSGDCGGRSEPSAGDCGGCGLGDWWLTEPDVGRVANGVPARVDRLRSLGNALVPQIAEWIGRRIVDYEAQRVR